MMEPYIGSHLSTAGGWDALLGSSHEEGGTTFAFFPCPPYDKHSKVLDPAGAAAFDAHLKVEGYGSLVVHASYVYNLIGKDEARRTFTVKALAEDIELLITIHEASQEVYINTHPGTHVGQDTEIGCRLASEGLNQVFEHTTGVMVLLETMTDKGTGCGRNFEELATIMNSMENEANIGIMLNICHVPDAGYDLVHDYDGVMCQLNEAIGLAKVRAIHVNDSRFGFGSCKDHRANIEQGRLGISFFARLVNDLAMVKSPMILETREQMPTTYRDEVELLRGLMQKQSQSTSIEQERPVSG